MAVGPPSNQEASEAFPSVQGSSSNQNIAEALFSIHDPYAVPPKSWRNVNSLIELVAAEDPTAPCLGTRSYTPEGRGDFEWLSFEETVKLVDCFAGGLHTLGLKKGDKIGIMAKNRVEWCISDLACARLGIITVPLYDTQGPKEVEFISQQSDITAILVAAEHLPLLRQLWDEPSCEAVKTMVLFDYRLDDAALLRAVRPDLAEHTLAVPEYVKMSLDAVPADERANLCSLVTHSFTQLCEVGRTHQAPAVDITADDLLTFVYTSGTMGDPKGVMITHGNILTAVVALIPYWPKRTGDMRARGEYDSIISYLPNAHVFMRVISFLAHINVGGIGFSQGDTRKLMDDIACLRPSVFPCVPRILTRMFDVVSKQVAAMPAVTRFIFSTAYAMKRKALFDGPERRQPNFLVQRVFKKTEQVIGGRVRLIFTGSAPLPVQVNEFIQVVFGSPVIEGYGMTESCSTAAGQITGVQDMGNVGVPEGNLQIKLIDVPDLDYLVSDSPNPRGEVLLKGGNIFKGYYKAEDKTAEVIDDDGWFHTGDIGEMLPGNRLKLIDRKRNIFKMAQGEFVCGSAIEDVCTANCPAVGSIFIYGNRYESFLVAVVVPNKTMVDQWWAELGKDKSVAYEARMTDADIVGKVHEELLAACRKAGLRSFEHPKAVILDSEEWAIDSGLMTPSMKPKRAALKVKYKQNILHTYVAIKNNVPNVNRLAINDAAELSLDAVRMVLSGKAGILDEESLTTLTFGSHVMKVNSTV
ncbi:acylCoA synthetase [Carpediemonas membranifera]|uniref:AcylCoA synthetase n=1 Tax=Carpediemonas membranifera TaxID=201153 RepID=A0A8J6B1B0_9EUKA|nr:acylCoA synthetase [Carpediemonas membranifera]|eukprot:KAG9397175.1 acylCoA synthetase [Carpediemonas membranifera]